MPCFDCTNYKECKTCNLNPCPMQTANQCVYSGCCVSSGRGIVHASQMSCTAHVPLIAVLPTCGDCDNFIDGQGVLRDGCGLLLSAYVNKKKVACSRFSSSQKVSCSTKSCTGSCRSSCQPNPPAPSLNSPMGINLADLDDNDNTPEDGFEIVDFPPEPEPKNNDGRTNCFWCKGKTVKIDSGFSFYDYCKRCKK
jgi:hypothetical protein